jgi:hypothetical protein
VVIEKESHSICESAGGTVIFFDFILDVVGYTTARLLLPTLTFQKVKVDALSSNEIGFNWLGFKRLPNGALLCDADPAGWIGALFWLVVLAVVITGRWAVTE